MKVHKFALAIPEMTHAEFVELKADLKANGQRIPIISYQDQILDGRNRYRALKELKMLVNIKEFRGSEVDAANLVISLNIKRRHLTVGQRTQIGIETLLPAMKKQAKENQKQGGKSKTASLKNKLTSGKAASQVAKAVGVSASAIEQAIKVKEKAKPEVIEKVKAGKMSLGAAIKTLKPEPLPETSAVEKARLAGLKSLDEIANTASLWVFKERDFKTLRRIASLYASHTKEMREDIKGAFNKFFTELDRYEEGFNEHQ